jgi:hypothetical protein
MDRIVDELAPARDYDKRAKNVAKVVIDQVWFDEGYRSARLDEIVKLDALDFKMLIAAKQVEDFLPDAAA